MSVLKQTPNVFGENYLEECVDEVEELNLLHMVTQQLVDKGYEVVEPFIGKKGYLISRTEGFFTRLALKLRTLWHILSALSVLCFVTWIILFVFYVSPDDIDDTMFYRTFLPASAYIFFTLFFFTDWCNKRRLWKEVESKIDTEVFHSKIQSMGADVVFETFRPAYSTQHSNISGVVKITFKSGKRQSIYFEGY